MGFLNALLLSAERFRGELLPIGYEYRDIKWVIDIASDCSIISYNRNPYKKREMQRVCPKAPGSRTSGIIATLLVDDASYVLGIVNDSKRNSKIRADKEHKAFVRLHRLAARYMRNLEIGKAIQTLQREIQNWRQEIQNNSEAINPLTVFKPKDTVAIRTSSSKWAFDSIEVQNFWSRYLERQFSDKQNQCIFCGQDKASLRILPFNIRMFGQKVPIVSVNTKEQPAFSSLGKEQLDNAPACYICLGKAQQVLQYLLKLDYDPDNGDKKKQSGRHAVILARDTTKGAGKQPLRNQIAIFWTKDTISLDINQENKQELKTFEDLAKIPLEELDFDTADFPAYSEQMRVLIEKPFKGGSGKTMPDSNRFYLAVLSPNKSRLVVREWLEYDIQPVKENIVHYMRALQITHPDGRAVWSPPLPAMLEGVRSYTSTQRKNDERPRLPQMGPDVIRKIIRCIYTAAPPPETLLVRAVRCFRVPDVPTENKEQRERQMIRRMAMAATMKLILTYDKNDKEQNAMEQLKTKYDDVSEYKNKAPYRCGQLLAILEAIQRRASSSGRGVNTTLVDRFYGAASTAPATVFANLINMTTKAHSPKLRRESKEIFKTRSSETVNINNLLEDVCKMIDEAGGFPPPLTSEQQAQFALGFYHQRAEFNPPKN
jgi:CRISPR-associated protein Csd1